MLALKTCIINGYRSISKRRRRTSIFFSTAFQIPRSTSVCHWSENSIRLEAPGQRQNIDARDVCARPRNNEITGGKSGLSSLRWHSAALRLSLGWRAGGRSPENSCRTGTVVVVARHRRVRSNGAVNVSRVHTYNLTSTLPSLCRARICGRRFSAATRAPARSPGARHYRKVVGYKVLEMEERKKVTSHSDHRATHVNVDRSET